MEAKDTVMTIEQIEEILYSPKLKNQLLAKRELAVNKAQAEITWPLAFQAGRESMVREVQRIRAKGRKDVLALLGNNYPDEARAIRHTLKDRN